MFITFPSVLKVDESIAENSVRQIGELGIRKEGQLPRFAHKNVRGFLFQPRDGGHEVLILPTGKATPQGHARILRADVNGSNSDLDLSTGKWLRHPIIDGRQGVPDYRNEITRVLESWATAFSYVAEDQERGIIGLRSAQIGALHAIHAHWSVSDAPATVVMPTGTGKTETMLSILVSVRCPKLLVVVPTDALRFQIVRKFLSLGILKAPGSAILKSSAQHPIVCALEHIPKSTEEVDLIFSRSQVIVATSSIAGRCEQFVQDRMAHHCPYLFIDEAHHVEAPSWTAFKDRFKGRRVVQFTATPFREDGKPLDGKIIFSYPLQKAQREGYFRPIHFVPVVEFNRNRSDRAIATKAIEQLREDLGRGHVLMARVDNVARAREVFELYRPYTEFNPVQLHTGIKSLARREEIRRQIISGESRIIVCVDMLGEGFDLPQLKIAAFHDIRKTLAVTLQLAGRFTRAQAGLGNASFIANVADVSVRDELRKLYTRDPDWNVLLPQLSESMVGEQVSLQEFLRGFTDFTSEIPLKSARPAMSAVAYRTTCSRWRPENFRHGIPGIDSCEQVHHAINHETQTLVVITARRVPLDWTDVESLFSWAWELYVAVWIPEQNLLFINSSTNAGEYRALAHAIVGDTASLIQGQEVFRVFSGVKRLQLQNVGLTEQLGRNVRYTGRMGADVEPALTDAQRQRARKSVLSGSGYEDGSKTTVGASRKGRIWSQRRGRLDQWVAWCKKIGDKLLDTQLGPDEVLRGTLDATRVVNRPHKIPIGIDWPERIYMDPESVWSINVGERQYQLGELSIELVSPDLDSPLRFRIATENDAVEVELVLYEDHDGPNYRFGLLDERQVLIRRGQRADAVNIAHFFYNDPPMIWFFDGSAIEGNQYTELKRQYAPYDVRKVQAWDWAGVDIRKESQGPNKEADSIQARVIRELRGRDYHAIFDDDGKGEAADIVAIRLIGEATAPSRIDVEFYHCKYSQEATPGQRVADLYEVCGQAQKSIFWMCLPEKRADLFAHLLRREARRQETGISSRHEVGDGELLQTIREMSHLCAMSLKIFVVQPGLSKSRATREQLSLLSVTENYLMETYQVEFGVIASA